MRQIIRALAFLGLVASFAQDPRPAHGQEKPPALQAPTLMLQKGHADLAYTIAVSKDSKWLVTAGHNGTPTLWETATGRQVRTFHGHRDFINDMVFSDDGKWLATCSGEALLEIDEANDTVRLADATTRLWNVATGQQERTFKHNGKVTRLAMSADGKLLATAGSDRTARLWNTATGQQLRAFLHPAIEDDDDGVRAVALSANGKLLFTADDRVRIWDTTTGKQIRELPPHNDKVKTFKYAKAVPVEGAEKIPGKVEFRTIELDAKFRTSIDHLALSADGKQVVTVGSDKRAVVWDVESGKSIRVLETKRISFSTAVTADGRWLFVNIAKSVEMWDLTEGKEVRAFPLNRDLGHDVCVSWDGKFLFATDGSPDEANVSARMWDVATGRLVRTFAGKLESVNAVALSDDGKRLVTASGNEFNSQPRTAQMWDLATGKQVRVFQGHKGTVNCVAISRDGQRVASGGGDEFARLWDADTGKELHAFLGKSGSVTSVAFSRDGQWLAAGSGGMGLWTSDPERGFGTRSFSLETRTKARFFDQIEGVRAVALSNDGKHLVTGGWDKKLRLWDMNTGKVLHELAGHADVVAAVGLTTDGQWLVSSSHDGTARLWETKTGKHLRTFKGHTGAILCLALSRDGKSIATGGGDRTVRLEDLATGKTIRIFKGHTESVTAVALSADGKRLVTGSVDGTTRIWNVSTGQELCRLLTLTDGTWVVLDSTGQFDSSAEGDIDGIHWVSGMDTSPLRDRVPGLLGKLLAD